MLTWSEYGLCRGENTERWFPKRTNDVTIDPAKAICHACPVQQECLAYGLQARHQDGTYVEGIWGGATYEERIRIRMFLGGRTLSDVYSATG